MFIRRLRYINILYVDICSKIFRGTKFLLNLARIDRYD